MPPKGLFLTDSWSWMKSSARHTLSNQQAQVTEFRQPLQVQSHLEMPRILVQLGHIQRT